MRNDRCLSLGFSLTLSLLIACLLAGCGGGYTMPARKPTVTKFRLTHHTGGTHYRVLTVDGRCILAFGSSVQGVDPSSLAVINDVPLGEFGQCGPVVDLALDGERLWAIVEDDAVVEMDLPAGLSPKMRRTISSDELGILPRRFSVIDDAIYVSGPGGVIRLSDRKKIFSSEDDCGSVARAGNDLVVCIGRRVHRLADGGYVGAASELVNLPADVTGGTPATLAYVLRSDANALAGLMTPDVREVLGGKATVAMAEGVERVRMLGGRMFIVGPKRIDIYDIRGDALELAAAIDIMGARDIDQLDKRTFIVVGTAGRAMYQFDEGSTTTGRFISAEREASRLTLATGDGLNILAGSREGAWMYLSNARAELTRRTIESAPPGSRVANAVDAQATISLDGQSLSVKPAPGSTTGSPWEYRERKGAKLHTVVAVDGDFWVGHDRGITILRADGGLGMVDPKVVAKAKADPSKPMPVADPVKERLRLPGPVRYLFPLLAGSGATYVSEFGGFGVAQFLTEESLAPSTSK